MPGVWFGPPFDLRLSLNAKARQTPTNNQQSPIPGWDRLGASPGSRAHVRRANHYLGRAAISAALGCGAVASEGRGSARLQRDGIDAKPEAGWEGSRRKKARLVQWSTASGMRGWQW